MIHLIDRNSFWELWVDGVYCGKFDKSLEGMEQMLEAAKVVL